MHDNATRLQLSRYDRQPGSTWVKHTPNSTNSFACIPTRRLNIHWDSLPLTCLQSGPIMRLLQGNSDGEFCLKGFGDEIPPYAILSHTWGPDNEEVTFEDMINGTGEDKPGYEKIRFCGGQARQNGLPYFWIDTCCINKGNDAKLSRSINSMFCWYRNATRCYVYLSDVSSPLVDANNKWNLRPWESDFRKSRWFTRGWTL
jgi:hypothetical protein